MLYYENDAALLYQADCSTAVVQACSMDSLVTDPPAGIGWMGNEWDKSKDRDTWVAWAMTCFTRALNALKPGAYGVVWALPRRSHWTAYALESAGFEILDVVHHLYGEGMPKNHDISVAVDRELKMVRPVIGVRHNTYDGVTRDSSRHNSPVSNSSFGNWGLKKTPHNMPKTGPASEQAKMWDGFGTALKPSCEHWILVRKPVSEKTLAKNVLKHGTGGMNIDASRLESGRWPANTIGDGEVLDTSYAHFFYAAKPGKKERSRGCSAPNSHPTVKSQALMSYLIRLVTPPDGLVLDIFAGSGSTGVAALSSGFGFVGVENNADYLAIAAQRLAAC